MSETCKECEYCGIITNVVGVPRLNVVPCALHSLTDELAEALREYYSGQIDRDKDVEAMIQRYDRAKLQTGAK